MKTAEFRSLLKRNSLVFFTYKKLTDSLYRSNMIDYLIQKHGKSQDHLQCSIGGMRRKLNVTPASGYLQTGFRKYLLRP